ncbi:FtsX-like permease family protein [Streptomyces fagopyri]|uniref:FtsX-like permease family protein n=1 Tax=Streptomyces fagopyri TaxID=2662397 RepID=A0A5Q0LJ11_9ACTN|nr:FtsX-like permease family protein [Streptomyces fagopyri]QFZ76497.1 FtsX-like permease family protein [Streptomyces fagopyri]
MRELLLGLKLLLGSGRGNRARFALMVAGGSLGVCCLAIVLAIPGILESQDGRVAARQRVVARDSTGRAISDGFPLAIDRTDPYGATPLTRVFIARGTREIEPPPGLVTLPRDGQVFTSPALHRLLRAEPGLAQRLPGKEAGLIGAKGLARPDELVAYVGVSRSALSDGRPVRRWGIGYVPIPTMEPATLDTLRFAMAGVVLLPLTVFLSVCARLSAAERTRRLAALRLLGLSRKGTQRVNAAETVAAATLGAVLGLFQYEVVNQLVCWVGLPGFSMYPSDGNLSATTVVVCLVGCPALAWFVGRASARKAAASPLAVRRGAVEKAPSKWGFVPLAAGVGVMTGYCVAGATGHVPTSTFLSAWLVPSAIVLVGVGLVLSLPELSGFLARRVARTTESLPLGLAMRRNEAESGGVLRVAAGLVLLVFVASLAQGVVIQMNEVSRNTSAVQRYDILLEKIGESQRRALESLPGLRTHFAVMTSDYDGGELPHNAATAVVASCTQLRRAVRSVEGCVDGRPLWLRDSAPTEGGFEAGDSFHFALGDGRHNRDLKLTVPDQKVRVHNKAGSEMIGGEAILLPPTMLPRHVRYPLRTTLVLVSDSDNATVRRVLDGIGAAVPTEIVVPQGVDVTALQENAIVKTLLTVGIVLGLVIGVAAYLVAATDRAVERRPQVTALTLLGARARTLRAVQVAQVVLPLVVGLVPAVLVGKMAETSYLVVGGGTVFWDGAGVPVLLVGALGVVAVAAVGALPLVGRRIDPELIRRH